MIHHAQRTVEQVPFLVIDLLSKGGMLPRVPPAFEPDPDLLGFRTPTLEEAARMIWVAVWDGPRLQPGGFVAPAGIASYSDDYDWHSASDVRRIEYLAGSPRAVRDLLLFIRDSAVDSKRRCIGAIDTVNVAMLRAAEGLGFEATRIVLEYPR